MNLFNGFDSSKEISLQERYESFIGGLPMLIPNLAENMIFTGYEEFTKILSAGKDDPIKTNRDNYHYLYEGIIGIPREEIEPCIQRAALTLKEIDSRTDLIKNCNETLSAARAKWDAYVKTTIETLLTYSQWAYQTELDWRNSIFNKPFFQHRFLNPFTPLKMQYNGLDCIMVSPEEFTIRRARFDSIVKDIQRVLESVYRFNKLPDHISASEFNEIINTIYTQHEHFAATTHNFETMNKELNDLIQRFHSESGPLKKQLWLMPESAKQALFRIYNPELFENAGAEEGK